MTMMFRCATLLTSLEIRLNGLDISKIDGKAGLWRRLGPGLITGAADDDPSGIATYAQAGAQFGFSVGWTLLLSYPLMVAIQAISARIGRTTGKGIAANLRAHYPGWLVQTVVGLLVVANVLNLGADLGAMAEAAILMAPLPAWACIVAFALVCTAGQVFLQQTRYAAALKWLTASLLAYFATLCVVHVSWGEFFQGLVWPHLTFDRRYSCRPDHDPDRVDERPEVGPWEIFPIEAAGRRRLDRYRRDGSRVADIRPVISLGLTPGQIAQMS